MDGGTPTKEEEEKVKSEKRIGLGFVSAELELVALTDGRQKLIWPFGYFVFAFVALFCFYIFLLSTFYFRLFRMYNTCIVKYFQMQIILEKIFFFLCLFAI